MRDGKDEGGRGSWRATGMHIRKRSRGDLCEAVRVITAGGLCVDGVLRRGRGLRDDY